MDARRDAKVLNVTECNKRPEGVESHHHPRLEETWHIKNKLLVHCRKLFFVFY